MSHNNLGRTYQDRECVVRQGEEGNTMFVILDGKLEVLGEQDGHQTQLAILERGEVFGEMALFEQGRRSSTVRALGVAQVMTLDKRTLLRRIKEDPLVALNLIEMLCRRTRNINAEYSALKIAGKPENAASGG